MGRLSKHQISRKNAAKKGGRGRIKQQTPPMSPQHIKTPSKPKTTASRHRTIAASAEQALHIAALANIKNLAQYNSDSLIVDSRTSTSTGHRSTIARRGSTFSSTVGSDVGGDNASIKEGLVEEEKDFEDIEELELILSPEILTQLEEDRKNAIYRWPIVSSLQVKREIIKINIILNY